jgi:hypothetical protein
MPRIQWNLRRLRQKTVRNFSLQGVRFFLIDFLHLIRSCRRFVKNLTGRKDLSGLFDIEKAEFRFFCVCSANLSKYALTFRQGICTIQAGFGGSQKHQKELGVSAAMIFAGPVVEPIQCT